MYAALNGASVVPTANYLADFQHSKAGGVFGKTVNSLSLALRG